MKKSLKLLSICSVLFFSCMAGSRENETLKERIREAIISYETDSVQKGGVVIVDTLAVVGIDSLTKKEFALKSAEKFKKRIYLFTKIAQGSLEDISQLRKDTTNAIKNSNEYSYSLKRLNELQLELDTTLTILHASQISLDSCNSLSKESDPGAFYGYIATAYRRMRFDNDTIDSEWKYLITKDMKAGSYANWDELSKQLSDSGIIKPIIKTDTQD